MIGREPNTNMEMGNHAGAYDWREYPRAGFWNMAYSLMAGTVGLKGYVLKRICLRCNGSPILIANALPHGVESKIPNKKPQRMVVQSRASQHINTIFSFADLISRVEVVVMSGLFGEQFAASREAIVEQCRGRKLHLASVPFFFGPNKAKILKVLTEADGAKMKGVTSAFLASCREAGGL
jgi:hypothetical protein